MTESKKIKSTVLVTGASGTVGREVIDQLVKLNKLYDVRVFDVKNAKSMRLFDRYRGKIKVYYGDITKPEDLDEPTQNVEYVIHLAAIIPPLAYNKPELTTKVNVEGTKNLLEALETNSPKCFFALSSSVAVYGDRMSNPYIRVTDKIQPSYGDNYGETKVQMENLVQQSKLDWTIFRLSAIMGADNHKITPLMFYMPLDTPVEITTPEDTARAFVRACMHREELNKTVFNLGGGELCRTSYRRLLQRNFHIFGLGKLDFPLGAFAIRNYHCGYYADGDNLEDILHFRKDTLGDYYHKVEKNASWFKKLGALTFSDLIKKVLLQKSEPYVAFKQGDAIKMKKFF
ncbi:NAD(P)-dependent oxidoreductase [Porphyromonas pogonae]|uniref:NAD-dependent epimerase/dehydratase family protein n=1 Tax=Porphyromonas pogonae TaxID=867595 RepID=UPI002E784087|nr:NAD(P)-dependent oxidoreductase [Porphyromonas pogonae]